MKLRFERNVYPAKQDTPWFGPWEYDGFCSDCTWRSIRNVLVYLRRALR